MILSRAAAVKKQEYVNCAFSAALLCGRGAISGEHIRPGESRVGCFGVRVSSTLPPRESRVPRLNAVTRQRGSLCSSNMVFRGAPRTFRQKTQHDVYTTR